jgi:hypothetical protein
MNSKRERIFKHLGKVGIIIISVSIGLLLRPLGALAADDITDTASQFLVS